MDITEVKRRLAILKSTKQVPINKRMLRGGMDYRNKRKNISRYNNNIKNQTDLYKDKLIELESPLDNSLFSTSSEPIVVDEVFSKPKLNKTRIGALRWI